MATIGRMIPLDNYNKLKKSELVELVEGFMRNCDLNTDKIFDLERRIDELEDQIIAEQVSHEITLDELNYYRNKYEKMLIATRKQRVAPFKHTAS